MRRPPQPEHPILRTSARGFGRVFIASEGRWAVRMRCPDGVVRQFFTEPVYAVEKRRKPMRSSVRFGVLTRDGYTCRYCGRSAPTVAIHVDHIIPVAKGGTDDPANLVAACEECNQGKSDRTVDTMVANVSAPSVA